MENRSSNLLYLLIAIFTVFTVPLFVVLGLSILLVIPVIIYYTIRGIAPFKSVFLHFLTLYDSVLFILIGIQPESSSISYYLILILYLIIRYTLIIAFLCGIISILQQYFGPRDPAPLEVVITRAIRWMIGIPGDIISWLISELPER